MKVVSYMKGIPNAKNQEKIVVLLQDYQNNQNLFHEIVETTKFPR